VISTKLFCIKAEENLVKVDRCEDLCYYNREIFFIFEKNRR
jgi:hypothetical protein